MQTISKDMVRNIKAGQTLLFQLDNSACVSRAKQAVHYVKMNLQMPEGVVGYKTSFDKETNIFSVEALAE